MIKDTKRTRRVLGATAGVNLVLALAVVGGAIPLQGQPSVLSSASATPLHATAPTFDGAEQEGPAAMPADGTPMPSAASTAETHAGPASADEPGSPGTAAPGPMAEAAVAPSPAPPGPGQPAVSTPAPAPAGPATPMAHPPVPRRQPSPAEVQQALDGLARYVDSVFTPTAAQVQEAGDKVCTAFDEGQTFTQVKATARELVARVPLTTVHPGADDYVVRTVVALYCPGHAPKLA